MPNNTGIHKNPASAPRLDPANPALWFGVGLCLVMLVPIIPLAPWLQTFVHPWRPELAASLFLLGFLVWGYRSVRFRGFLSGIEKAELLAIILPCAAFITWSFLSAFYAVSWRSAMHHTLVWSIYLVFFLFLRHFLNRSADARTVIVAPVAAVLVIALPGVIEYYTSVNTGDPTTIGIRYSKYAEMLNTLFPVILAFTLRLKGRAFWLGAVTVVLMWLFAIGSLSRAAVGLYIAGTVLMAIAIFAVRRFRHYRGRFAVLALLLVAVPLLLHAPAFLGSKGVPLVDRMQDRSITESTNVRPFFSRIAIEMVKANPFTGVGADNFGREFHKYREIYAEGHRDDRNLSIAEAEIPERAHNEFMQIAAELGIPGIVLFGWFMAGIAWMFFRVLKKRFRVSLVTMGAFAGMALFFASSMVTSYSFRILQNGFVFFVVLGFAAKGLLSSKAGAGARRADGTGPAFMKLGFSAALLCCCLLAALSVSRAAGAWYGYKAAGALSIDDASASFSRSYILDDENASVYAVNGLYLFNAGKFPDAAFKFRKAIDVGRATTVDYSYLASSQSLAGDLTGAEASLAEAARIYPYSVFIRTRYAAVLKEAGKQAESDAQFDIAREIDPRQAETWRNLIENGAVAASRSSFDNKLLR
jgi:O-antigen ligase